jgi:putative phosphoesterase
MPKSRLKVGVISDTHNLLRPEAKRLLKGVDRILHAGDICGPEVLAGLATLAPVTAVRGNNDKGAFGATLPADDIVDIGGVLLYVLHDLQELAIDPTAAGIRVVISGHSHRPAVRSDNRVLYVNPGSAGPRRFSLPVTLAILDIADGIVTPTLHTVID